MEGKRTQEEILKEIEESRLELLKVQQDEQIAKEKEEQERIKKVSKDISEKTEDIEKLKAQLIESTSETRQKVLEERIKNVTSEVEALKLEIGLGTTIAQEETVSILEKAKEFFSNIYTKWIFPVITLSIIWACGMFSYCQSQDLADKLNAFNQKCIKYNQTNSITDSPISLRHYQEMWHNSFVGFLCIFLAQICFAIIATDRFIDWCTFIKNPTKRYTTFLEQDATHKSWQNIFFFCVLLLFWAFVLTHKLIDKPALG